MTLQKRVYVDWDRDGSFETPGDDISAYVKTVSWRIGMWDRTSNVARAGRASVTLNNVDRVFSLFYTGGPYYGRLTVNLPVRIDASDGGSTWTVFLGVITDIQADSGDLGAREARLTAEDYIGVLSRTTVTLPRRTAIAPDAALKLISSAAFPATRATGTITLDANVSDGDTVTIGETVYTFESGTLDTPYEVRVGGSEMASAMNLAAAINAAQTGTTLGYGAATVYDTGTLKHPDVTAKITTLGTGTGGTTSIEPVDTIIMDVIGRTYMTDRRLAQQFEIDGGPLSELQFYIGDQSGSPGTVTWELFDTVGGTPGTVLQSGTFTPTLNDWNVISVTDGITLYDNTKYWAGLRLTNVPPTTAYYEWKFGATNYSGGLCVFRDGTAPWVLTPSWDQFMRVTTGTPGETVIEVTAIAYGAWGNDLALSATGTHLAASDVTLTGGTDGPADLIDFQAGTCVLDEIGANWQPDRTTGLIAVTDVTESEGTALFWGDRDGTLTYKNRDWVLAQRATTPDVTIHGEFQRGPATISLDDIMNRVTLRYRPSTTLTAGVIAQATGTLTVPGTGIGAFASGSQERHNPSDAFGNSDATELVRLSYVNPETGNITGAKDLTLPLVAGTDFSIAENQDGTGYDYTNDNLVLFSAAALSGGVDITMQSSATGPLYVIGLQQRGTAIVQYDPIDVMREDAASIAVYGLREKKIELPFTANNTETFAPVFARYLVRRYANPQVYQNDIIFQNITEVSGVNLFGLAIGSIAEISESQTGADARRTWIAGISGSIDTGGATTLQWFVRQLDNSAYGVWDNTTYGLWDTCVWSL